MQKLISIDLKADFGFFRKPDANSGINLSYNMIHKPSVLGIFGAIIGLEGYKEFGKMPSYYNELSNIKISIEPLQHEKGNFIKTVVKYTNTVGYANKEGTYLTEEAILIKPQYRCYVLLEMENEYHAKLYNYLREGKAEYLPYFGKNEFAAWWEKESFRENYEMQSLSDNEDFEIVSLFSLEDKQDESVLINFSIIETRSPFTKNPKINYFIYFERLPNEIVASTPAMERDRKPRYGYGLLKKFVYSNILFNKSIHFNIPLVKIGDKKVIQLY